MDKEIALRGDKELALYELETRFAMAVRQRELLENYIRERLQPDKHFYTVGDEPGRKPSLTKEGAELICLPHALKGHYEWISGPEAPPMDDSPYQITMRCSFENNNKFEGEGVGSASSMVTRKDGTRVQRQKDPGLRHNATIKMACKSAYIAATLNSTAASEFFTQDLEDDQTGEFKKKAQPDKSQHWCELHQTNFFMKGKMKGYAHPIEGTDPVEWCHEPKSKPPVKKQEPEKQQEQGVTPLESTTAGVKEPESIIDLDWLKESLNTLQWTDCVGWLNRTYGTTGKRVSEIVKELTAEDASEFTAEVQSRLEML